VNRCRGVVEEQANDRSDKDKITHEGCRDNQGRKNQDKTR